MVLPGRPRPQSAGSENSQAGEHHTKHISQQARILLCTRSVESPYALAQQAPTREVEYLLPSFPAFATSRIIRERRNAAKKQRTLASGPHAGNTWAGQAVAAPRGAPPIRPAARRASETPALPPPTQEQPRVWYQFLQ